MKQVLIFDYDGVIVDSLSLFMKFFFEACELYGYKDLASKEEFLKLFDGNMFDKMMEKGMSEKTILKIVNHLKKELLKNQEKINIFPDIKFVLNELSNHFPLIISTSNETSVVRNYLKSKNIEHLFVDIYGSDIEPSKVKKIQLIQNQLDADKYTYVGDTVGDIKEAKQANIHTIAVSWGWHKKNDLERFNPDFLIQKPMDLISLLILNSSSNNDIKTQLKK